MADETENNAPEEETETTSTSEAPPADQAAPVPEADASASEADAAPDGGAQAPSEPAEILTPKQRRARGRAAKAAAVIWPTTPSLAPDGARWGTVTALIVSRAASQLADMAVALSSAVAEPVISS